MRRIAERNQNCTRKIIGKQSEDIKLGEEVGDIRRKTPTHLVFIDCKHLNVRKIVDSGRELPREAIAS